MAAITQHIPDKSFQLVRYYGWYSNKMRGQRAKQAAQSARVAGKADAVIDVSTIDDRAVIGRILRHLGLWQQGVRVEPGPDPP